MTGPHLTEERLVEIYYGMEPVPDHVAGCPDCAGRLRKLETVLDRVTEDPLPLRPNLADEAWSRLEPRLPRPRRQPLLWPRAAIAAALAAMLTLVFFAGRRSATPTPDAAIDLRQQVLLLALGQHFERSRILLTEVAHEQDPATWSGYRRVAAGLLESNRLYRQTAAEAGDAMFNPLLDDLERTLLELAHAPDSEWLGLQRRIRRRRYCSG